MSGITSEQQQVLANALEAIKTLEEVASAEEKKDSPLGQFFKMLRGYQTNKAAFQREEGRKKRAAKFASVDPSAATSAVESPKPSETKETLDPDLTILGEIKAFVSSEVAGTLPKELQAKLTLTTFLFNNHKQGINTAWKDLLNLVNQVSPEPVQKPEEKKEKQADSKEKSREEEARKKQEEEDAALAKLLAQENQGDAGDPGGGDFPAPLPQTEEQLIGGEQLSSGVITALLIGLEMQRAQESLRRSNGTSLELQSQHGQLVETLKQRAIRISLEEKKARDEIDLQKDLKAVEDFEATQAQSIRTTAQERGTEVDQREAQLTNQGGGREGEGSTQGARQLSLEGGGGRIENKQHQEERKVPTAPSLRLAASKNWTWGQRLTLFLLTAIALICAAFLVCGITILVTHAAFWIFPVAAALPLTFIAGAVLLSVLSKGWSHMQSLKRLGDGGTEPLLPARNRSAAAPASGIAPVSGSPAPGSSVRVVGELVGPPVPADRPSTSSINGSQPQ